MAARYAEFNDMVTKKLAAMANRHYDVFTQCNDSSFADERKTINYYKNNPAVLEMLWCPANTRGRYCPGFWFARNSCMSCVPR